MVADRVLYYRCGMRIKIGSDIAWFFLIFLSLFVAFGGVTNGFVVRHGYELGDILFGVGAYLFIYSISKVYFNYTDFLKIGWLKIFEIIVVPVIIFIGVKKKFIPSYEMEFINAIFSFVVYVLSLDLGGRVKLVINQSFLGGSWGDSIERKIFFSKFPPEEFSDMIGAHALYFALIAYLFI